MALDYIERNLCEELDEKMIAAIAGCTFSQFQRIFSYIAGISLYEYLRKRRLTLAAIELRHGGRSIIDTAVRYGYDTPSGFARAFKAHHQATPTEVKSGAKAPKLFSRLYFIGPAYTGNNAYRFHEGELKMAKLTHIDFKPFGPYKVVGCAIRTRQMSNEIPMLWGRFFADGSFTALMELCKDENNLTPLPDAYTGVMYHFKEDGSMTYLAGITFSETVQVPDGFDSFDIPAGTIAEAWITGEEYEIYSQGHALAVAAIEHSGHAVAWDSFYQCEAYTDERFETPKKSGNAVVTLDYYIPVSLT
jgi:AraC family transcriptional regulator